MVRVDLGVMVTMKWLHPFHSKKKESYLVSSAWHLIWLTRVASKEKLEKSVNIGSI